MKLILLAALLLVVVGCKPAQGKTEIARATVPGTDSTKQIAAQSAVEIRKRIRSLNEQIDISSQVMQAGREHLQSLKKQMGYDPENLKLKSELSSFETNLPGKQASEMERIKTLSESNLFLRAEFLRKANEAGAYYRPVPFDVATWTGYEIKMLPSEE